MRIGLAQARFPESTAAAVATVQRFLHEARARCRDIRPRRSSTLPRTISFCPVGRRLFTVNDLPFGIAICHEGWRYPETVRWAASRGAGIVFHPHFCGGPNATRAVTAWGLPGNPYYDKAQVCRSIENSIYFASVNYALEPQESATCLIAPDGECLAWAPYGQEVLLVHEIDRSAATGLLARRYSPGRYGEA